jgi:hypothetical protein
MGGLMCEQCRIEERDAALKRLANAMQEVEDLGKRVVDLRMDVYRQGVELKEKNTIIADLTERLRKLEE